MNWKEQTDIDIMCLGRDELANLNQVVPAQDAREFPIPSAEVPQLGMLR